MCDQCDSSSYHCLSIITFIMIKFYDRKPRNWEVYVVTKTSCINGRIGEFEIKQKIGLVLAHKHLSCSSDE